VPFLFRPRFLTGNDASDLRWKIVIMGWSDVSCDLHPRTGMGLGLYPHFLVKRHCKTSEHKKTDPFRWFGVSFVCTKVLWPSPPEKHP